MRGGVLQGVARDLIFASEASPIGDALGQQGEEGEGGVEGGGRAAQAVEQEAVGVHPVVEMRKGVARTRHKMFAHGPLQFQRRTQMGVAGGIVSVAVKQVGQVVRLGAEIVVAVEREVVGRCFFARQIRLPSEVRPLGVEFLVDHEQLVDVPERVFALSDRPRAGHGTEHRGTQQVRGENRIERGISRVEGVGVPRRAAPVVVRSGARAPCVILIEHVGRRRRSPGHKEVTRHARLV